MESSLACQNGDDQGVNHVRRDWLACEASQTDCWVEAVMFVQVAKLIEQCRRMRRKLKTDVVTAPRFPTAGWVSKDENQVF